jgi:signal transduction histidine kinase
MKTVTRIAKRLQAVPVFAKVMGIAFFLTLMFGAVMHWEITRTRQRILDAEMTAIHHDAEQQFIREHVGLESELLARRLAQVMAVAAAAGMLLAWWLARILTRPLQEVVTGAKRIQEGDLTSRLPVRAEDEIGALAVAFNKMAATLQQKETARQKLLRRAIEAGEEERKRLARELHDQTAQMLTALIAGLGALEARATDAGQRAAIASLNELAAETLGDIHNVSLTLRPAALDDLGLVAALEKHCTTVSDRFGKPVHFQSDGWERIPRLSSEVEVTLYRIAQEALTNAVRHAEATRIHVFLQRDERSVLVMVEDDGRGFDTGARDFNGDKLGLLGIEERVALIGGHACLESTPGGGTQLSVEIPINDPLAPIRGGEVQGEGARSVQ